MSEIQCRIGGDKKEQRERVAGAKRKRERQTVTERERERERESEPRNGAERVETSDNGSRLVDNRRRSRNV